MRLEKKIITIQHTESVHHTNGMIGSWTDWELTDRGKNQAKNIAKNLRKQFPERNFVLYSSPLIRAKQTADILGDEFETSPKLTDALKERSLGRANGKSVQWLKENIENQELNIHDRCFSDAESRYDVWKRLTPFYEQLISNNDENILLVSHGDTLSIFNVMWLTLAAEWLDKIDLSGSSGGVSFLHQNKNGKRVIKRLSDRSFLL